MKTEWLNETIRKAGEKPERFLKSRSSKALALAVILALVFFVLSKNLSYTLLAFFASFLAYFAFAVINLSLKASAYVRTMESVFPDVLQMTASNLRAGMTLDKALLLSAKPEFAPLDKEIDRVGREVATGVPMEKALREMAKRIGSERIEKIVNLIVTGTQAGGNISSLLEETAANMREKEFLEKKAASNILMYVIFIFFAVALGAPMLFALSSVLVQVIISLTAKIPAIETMQMSLPFTLRSVPITPGFITAFAILFIIYTDVISCLIIGLVNKGEEKAGLRYLLPLLTISLSIFFFMRVLLLKFLSSTIAGVSA